MVIPSHEACLFLFEDNHVAINMIMIDRSSAIRHVSRIHRMNFELLFDRFYLDSGIQIKFADTNLQIADILT